MMDDMSDQEKSVLLAKVMGWAMTTHEVVKGGWLFRPSMSDRWTSNLYVPANMALAWRVHLWMLDQELNKRESPYAVSPKPYTRWWNGNVPWMMVNAQRLWLDKILSLAIKAGIVVLNEEQSYKYFGDVRADDL